MKKCKKHDDVLFINAAEHFVKGKRQNQLAPEHIERIVETYQKRPKHVDRYARRGSMKESIENECSRNMSRYVRTAEPKKWKST